MNHPGEKGRFSAKMQTGSNATFKTEANQSRSSPGNSRRKSSILSATTHGLISSPSWPRQARLETTDSLSPEKKWRPTEARRLLERMRHQIFRFWGGIASNYLNCAVQPKFTGSTHFPPSCGEVTPAGRRLCHAKVRFGPHRSRGAVGAGHWRTFSSSRLPSRAAHFCTAMCCALHCSGSGGRKPLEPALDLGRRAQPFPTRNRKPV